MVFPENSQIRDPLSGHGIRIPKENRTGGRKRSFIRYKMKSNAILALRAGFRIIKAFQFVGEMDIVAPGHVRDAYAEYLQEAIDDVLGT